LWLGNLRANGHPNGGSWRQCQCTSCQGYFSAHHGTILHGKQVAMELIVRVLACLAEGLGIRATARGFEVDPNTVLHWLVEAEAIKRLEHSPYGVWTAMDPESKLLVVIDVGARTLAMAQRMVPHVVEVLPGWVALF
jgi:hypothetical protein